MKKDIENRYKKKYINTGHVRTKECMVKYCRNTPVFCPRDEFKEVKNLCKLHEELYHEDDEQ